VESERKGEDSFRNGNLFDSPRTTRKKTGHLKLCFFLFQTSEQFRERLNTELQKHYDIEGGRFPEGYQEAPLAYDAVWAVALGN